VLDGAPRMSGRDLRPALWALVQLRARLSWRQLLPLVRRVVRPRMASMRGRAAASMLTSILALAALNVVRGVAVGDPADVARTLGSSSSGRRRGAPATGHLHEERWYLAPSRQGMAGHAALAWPHAVNAAALIQQACAADPHAMARLQALLPPLRRRSRLPALVLRRAAAEGLLDQRLTFRQYQGALISLRHARKAAQAHRRARAAAGGAAAQPAPRRRVPLAVGAAQR
jgi:hypothetical protein